MNYVVTKKSVNSRTCFIFKVLQIATFCCDDSFSDFQEMFLKGFSYILSTFPSLCSPKPAQLGSRYCGGQVI